MAVQVGACKRLAPFASYDNGLFLARPDRHADCREIVLDFLADYPDLPLSRDFWILAGQSMDWIDDEMLGANYLIVSASQAAGSK